MSEAAKQTVPSKSPPEQPIGQMHLVYFKRASTRYAALAMTPSAINSTVLSNLANRRRGPQRWWHRKRWLALVPWGHPHAMRNRQT